MIYQMDRRVLLLNASYEPIAPVSIERAVCLILEGKAEIVTEHESREFRSPSFSIPWPQVVRLVRYIHIPTFRKVYLSRRAILARDNHTCAYCGGRATTMDHVVPRSRGGRHSWRNIVACCLPCNQRKDDRLLEELGWTLKFEPYEPQGARRIAVSLGHTHPSWDEWLQAVA